MYWKEVDECSEVTTSWYILYLNILDFEVAGLPRRQTLVRAEHSPMEHLLR